VKRKVGFLRVTSQLPLELQMSMCYRVMGSAKGVIQAKDSEPAFKVITSVFLSFSKASESISPLKATLKMHGWSRGGSTRIGS